MTSITSKEYAQLGEDAFEGTIIRIGYTQGELSEDREDFDDGFNAPKHCYWNFLILKDLTGECGGCAFLLIDLSKGSEYCFDTDEDLAQKIGELCSNTTEDMFGSRIIPAAFEAVAIGAIDEPSGYQCIEDVLDKIGGSLEEDYGNSIPEENTNSLFSYSLPISEDRIRIADGEIIIDGEGFDLESEYVSAPKLIFFTNDVMNYSE